MRDHDRGEAELALQPLDLDLHVETQVLVEGRERFVEQQDARSHGERARQGYALLLSAGKLARLALAKAFHAHGREHFLHAVTAGGLALAARLKPVGDVLGHGHVREERIALEDDADLAPVRRQGIHHAIADDHAPEVWLMKPATMRRSVDFPQPDGPSSATSSPARTSSVT